jgi:acyl-CoA dehydrogenase
MEVRGGNAYIEEWVNARRALHARFVLEHRLSTQDPLEPRVGNWERDAAEIIFSEHKVALPEIAGLLS